MVVDIDGDGNVEFDDSAGAGQDVADDVAIAVKDDDEDDVNGADQLRGPMWDCDRA